MSGDPDIRAAGLERAAIERLTEMVSGVESDIADAAAVPLNIGDVRLVLRGLADRQTAVEDLSVRLAADHDTAPGQAALGEAEREALYKALYPHLTPPQESVFFAAVERILAARLAKAWDEGWQAAWSPLAMHNRNEGPNPYSLDPRIVREQGQGEGGGGRG